MHWIVPVGPINIFGGKYHPVISEQAPAEADVFATDEADVFATDRNQGQLAETPWIFLNHTTSSAVDLQHQNEGDDHHCPSILADAYAWILFSNIRYSLYPRQG